MKRPFRYDMKGQYYEIIENGNARFFEIFYCEYSTEQVDRLKEIDSLDKSRLGQFMSLIDGEIPEFTEYLFMLQTYRGKIGINDALEFRQNTSDFQRIGFVSLDHLLKFCKENWGIEATDFKSISDTNIPH